MATKQTTKKPSAKSSKADDESQEKAGLNRATLLQFAILDTRKAALTTELKEVTEAHKVIQQQILDQFEHTGLDRVSFLGHTMYIFKQLWARPKDQSISRAQVVAALKSNGFAEYIKEDYNVQSVSGRLRELEKQYRDMHAEEPREGRKPFQLADYLPEALVKVLKLDPDYSIRIQGTIPMADLEALQEEVNEQHGNNKKQ